MLKTKRSTEEVNNLLFDDEPKTVNGKDQNAVVQQQNVGTGQQKPEPRLLKQRGLSTELEELAPVPYYKQPVVQTIALLVVAVPMGWGLVSAFSSDGASSRHTSATVAEDREKELLKRSLDEERKKTTELEIEKGQMAQKLEIVPSRPKPTPQPVHASQPSPRVVMAPPPVTTYAPPIRTYSPPPLPPPVEPVQREPSPAPIQVIKAPTPPPAPKAPPPTFEEQEQKWLAMSNVGNSGGNLALDDTSDNSSLAASATKQQRSLPSSGISQAPSSVVSEVPSPANRGFANSPASVGQSQAYQPASYTTSVGQSQAYQPASYTTTSEQPQAYQLASYGSAQVMVGSEAEAEIDRTLSWTASSSASGMRIPIRLTQAIKAIDNSEAIPAGSYLIAQVSGDSSGNLQLTPTSVLLNVNGRLQPERPLPAPGSLMILGANAGKPLHAQTSGGTRHRGNGFLSTIGSVAGIAPLPTGGYSNGIYAIDSLAQRSGQSYQSEPITYTLKQGTRCHVYVNQSFSINF